MPDGPGACSPANETTHDLVSNAQLCDQRVYGTQLDPLSAAAIPHFGAFEILTSIIAGGMGEVYRYLLGGAHRIAK